MQNDDKYAGKESPILKKIGNEDPFKVPEGYFENLSDSILGKVEGEISSQAPKGRIVRFRSTWRKPLRYAAAIALMLAISVFLVQDRLSTDQGETDWASEISAEEIETYVLENLYEFEEGDFLSQDLNLEKDLLENAFDDEELEALLPEMLDDIDMETIENMF